MKHQLLKRLAIVVLALFCLQETGTAGNTTLTTRKSRTSITGVHRRYSKNHRRSRRAHIRKFRFGSFGEPTLGDNPGGEDPLVRRAAVEALGNWNGSVVVVDPNTGRILSIVNQKLALQSAFTPCSTFKPVVALGALKTGIITPDTKLWVGGRARMTLAEALARSNNIFFLKLGEMLGFERLARYAYAFGFGEKAGLNLEGESPGKFPTLPPKGGGVGYLAYFGQDMQVTALQLAAAISAIANGGTLYYLQYPRTPEEAAQFQPEVRRQLDGFVKFFPGIKQGMAEAVNYGTGRLAFSPDEQIYGKTGTCSEDGARLGWFVSYANEQQPKYVVVVLLRGGRLMFGPHAAEIAGRVYRELREKEQTTTQASDLNISAGHGQR